MKKVEGVRTDQTLDSRNCPPLAATASMCGANEANSARPRAWARLQQPSPRQMSWGQALDTNLSQVLHPRDGAQLEGSKMDVLHYIYNSDSHPLLASFLLCNWMGVGLKVENRLGTRQYTIVLSLLYQLYQQDVSGLAGLVSGIGIY